jgi:NTE family protein
VFDNLGTSCLMPGRSEAYSSNVFSVDYIVTGDAGRGLLALATPIGWPSRVKRSPQSTFRKVQDGARGRLHDAAASEELAGFVMPYPQRDETLPCVPAGLIPRDAVADCPTDFRAMRRDALDMLTDRGEQLTRLLINRLLLSGALTRAQPDASW